MAKDIIKNDTLAMSILRTYKNQVRILFIADIMLVIALIIAIIK